MKNSKTDLWYDTNRDISTPEHQGVNSENLDQMVSFIKDSGKKINSFLMVRNGYRICEEYFFGYKRDDKMPLNSCTKSIISLLVGIAIDEGLIKSADEKVVEYFKDFEIENNDEKKQKLAIKHLLTMTTGFKFRGLDLYYIKQDTKTQLHQAINMQTEDEPGKVFKYFNGASHILSAILSKTTGKSTFEYAKEKLFGPLSIKDVLWEADKDGINFGCSGIFMTPFDMAKLGYLLLREGKWENRQIVSKEWIEESTKKQTDTIRTLFGSHGYGYQWWMNSFGGYSARGYGGQYIFIIPEKDIVIVFTGKLRQKDFLLPETLIEDYILK